VGFFDIVFQTTVSLHPDGEPSDFITQHDGIIRYEREGDGLVARVGRLRAYRIESALAADHGESLFDVCDSHSAELHEAHAQLYEPDGYGFKEALVRRYDAIDSDCLLIDYVVIHPQWRGLRLGLLALRTAVDRLGGGCGLAVCDIAPLNRKRPVMRRLAGSVTIGAFFIREEAPPHAEDPSP
jgi:hypothetical protein